MTLLAFSRVDAGSFLQTLVFVYSVVIIAWVVLNLVLSFGGRIPYSRAGNFVLDFLRDSSEPYLRIFRRVLPMMGPVDISPIVAIFALQIVGNLVASAVGGGALT